MPMRLSWLFIGYSTPYEIFSGAMETVAGLLLLFRRTITAGLFMGYERAAAARYAFLLAIPAVFGSGFYQLAKSWNEPGVFTLGETAVATIVAFFVALGVIAFFMSWISKHSFLPFVIYRVALGTLVLVLLAMGVIQPY